MFGWFKHKAKLDEGLSQFRIKEIGPSVYEVQEKRNSDYWINAAMRHSPTVKWEYRSLEKAREVLKHIQDNEKAKMEKFREWQYFQKHGKVYYE